MLQKQEKESEQPVSTRAKLQAEATSFIKRCKTDDFKCQKDSTVAAIPYFIPGIPELNVEQLDPLHYNEMDASSKELKLILRNIEITGLKNCQPKKVQRDVQNSKLYIKVLCTLNLDGYYEMNGRLLFLPIEGKGKIHAAIRKVLIAVEADLVQKPGKDDKVHLDIKSWKHTYELKDKSEIELENLFQGNEVLASAVKVLLKESSNDVIGEVAPPIIKAFLTKVIKVIHHFLREVPEEDLFLLD